MKRSSDRLEIGVVGLGYIGFSTAVHFACAGCYVTGHDIDANRVTALNNGVVYIDNIQFWVGFDYGPLVTAGMLSATSNLSDLDRADVIFVSVPTEQNGLPFMGIMDQVLRNVLEIAPDALIIIESTLTPSWLDRFLGDRSTRIAVSPRRDWFVDPGRNLKTIPRIVGGVDDKVTAEAAEVLGRVSKTVLKAPSYREAVLGKVVENAYRHVDIILANQLCLAFPNVDVRTVLELAGTKWNINSYYPNMGVGGYCVGPSSHYIYDGAPQKLPLSLLREAINWSAALPVLYADMLGGYEKIAFAGLAYKGGLKVDILSPPIEVAKELIRRGKEVYVHDPMYSALEQEKLVPGATAAVFPAGLGECDMLVLAADHMEYRVSPAAVGQLSQGITILDIHGIWADYGLGREDGVTYIRPGESGWVKRLQRAG